MRRLATRLATRAGTVLVALLLAGAACAPGDDGLPVEGGRWQEIPPAPIEPRLNHSATWTGQAVIVWGGGDGDGVANDGAAWDPAAQTWQHVPGAPIEARWGHDAFGAGGRLLVWGGTAGPDHLAECYTDGALYDPGRGDWQAVPPAPGPDRCGAGATWTGEELLVFGGHSGVGPPGEGDRLDDGARYRPATGGWSELPPWPLGPRADPATAWTGDEWIVLGGHGHGSGGSFEYRADGAAFDPQTDRWRPIADPPLSPRADLQAVWADGELVVFGGRQAGAGDEAALDAAAYDPSTDTWRAVTPLPSEPQASLAAVWDGTAVLVLGDAGEGAPAFVAYDPAGDRWRSLPDPPGAHRRNHAAAWTGTVLVLWGGQTPDDPSPPGAVWQPEG